MLASLDLVAGEQAGSLSTSRQSPAMALISSGRAPDRDAAELGRAGFSRHIGRIRIDS